MEPVQIEFTMNPDAYSRLMRRLASKRQFWYIGIGMAVFLIINRQIFSGPIYIWALPIVLFGVLFYLLFNLTINRTYKAATQLHQPLRYIFSEENIVVQSGDIDASYAWSDFEYVREMPEWFVLYQNRIRFNPIPKTAFNSEEMMDKFRNLLISKGLPINK